MTRPEFAKNEQLLKLAAEALGPLLDRVAFVGGATTILHLTEPIRDVRATADVDVIIDASRAEFQRAEKTLRALGFTHDPKVICRFHKGDLTVDFMPTDPKVLGFSSRWFASGLKTAREVDIGGAKIRVLDFPHFVACKLEAFAGRGNGDYLQSKDIEDLVAALAGRPAFAAELRATSQSIAQYIRDAFATHLSKTEFLTTIQAQMPRDSTVDHGRIIADIRELAAAQ
jgi:predicted nucleotidyltransferase